MNWKTLLTASALTLAVSIAPAHAAEKIRIGYWSSGVSLGYGAVLEAQPFLKEQGLDVEFVKFPDVNAPLRALAANSIDWPSAHLLRACSARRQMACRSRYSLPPNPPTCNSSCPKVRPSNR
mgnify:CR=1 FL=1